jgi:hypothetical protein
MPKPCRIIRAIAVSVVVLVASVDRAAAQASPATTPEMCRGDRALQGLPIRRVQIESRGGWQPMANLKFGPGDTFDFPTFSEAHGTVLQALSRDPLRDSFESAEQNSLSIFFVSSCVIVVEGADCGAANRCVDITMRPYSVRLDLSNPGGNAIPVPRSNRGTAYSQVPVFLRVLNPTFGVERDRNAGVSETAAVSTDLLTLPALIQGRTPAKTNTKLNLDLRASKSIDKTFYETNSELMLDRRKTGRFMERLSVFTAFGVNQQPLANGRHFNNASRSGVAVKLRTSRRMVESITLAGNYRWTGHRVFLDDPESPDELTGEQSFESRILLDGAAGDGRWRAGVWLEENAPAKKTFENYRRMAVMGGYQSEIGKTEQTVGLELLVGAGRVWGAPPAYARFYGGSKLSGFLYGTPETPAMRSFPDGPLLRNFGRGQSTASNAASRSLERGYWHVNLNVTLPLPKLSCPLIPALALFDNVPSQNDAASPCKIKRPPAGIKTLKDSINGMVNTGESFLSADIADELVATGVDPDQADKEGAARAAKVFSQIRPAMRFITEKANLYAFKPLFMLDVGTTTTSESAEDHRTRVALGGGLQLTVATAKFELGYVRGVRRFETDPKGNLIARLVFQNLF